MVDVRQLLGKGGVYGPLWHGWYYVHSGHGLQRQPGLWHGEPPETKALVRVGRACMCCEIGQRGQLQVWLDVRSCACIRRPAARIRVSARTFGGARSFQVRAHSRPRTLTGAAWHGG